MHHLVSALWAFSVLTVACAAPPKQATSRDIVLRNYSRRSGVLSSQGSSTPCASGLTDAQNTCCTAGETLKATKDGSQCCSTHLYEPVCGEGYACCKGGASQILTITHPNDAEGKIVDNTQQCCAAGETVTDNNSYTAYCAKGSRKRDEHAVMLSKHAVRRGLQDDPLRQISFRPDSAKITLSPHLVADLVLNDWSFQYRGRTFVDHESRQRGKGYWQQRIAKRMPGFVKYGGAKYIARSIQKLHASGQQYLPLASEYDIKMDDIPLVWGALMDNAQFRADQKFYLEGAEWDTDTIRTIITAHPDWNATLHDR